MRVTIGYRFLVEKGGWGRGPLKHFFFSTTQKLQTIPYKGDISLFVLFVFVFLLLFFFIELGLFREVKTSTPFLLHFYFSGGQESISDFIDISGLDWPERDNVRGTLVRSGFADDRLGKYKLSPCPLGTFVDRSLTNPNCKTCCAGKL